MQLLDRKHISWIISALLLFTAPQCLDGFKESAQQGTAQKRLQVTVSGASGPFELTNFQSALLTIPADGVHTFEGTFEVGTPYNIEVNTHPDGQTCTIDGGRGVISAKQSATDVTISCVDGLNPEIVVENNDGYSYTSGEIVEFGGVLTGDIKYVQLTLRNTGAGPLDFTADPPFEITGGNGEFYLATNLAFAGFDRLEAGESFTVRFALSSSTAGNFTSTLFIDNTDSDESDFNLNLTGSVTDSPEPEIQVLYNMAPITSGGQTVTLPGVEMNKSDRFEFTIRNIGTDSLGNGFGGDMTASTGGPDFVMVSASAGTLDVDEESIIQVDFNPVANITYSDTISIVNNDADENPFEIPIAADGLLPPTIQVADSVGVILPADTFDYGSIFTDQSTTEAFRIYNNGQVDLQVTPGGLAGANPSAFSVIDSGTITVAPGEFETMRVRFAPGGVPGQLSATLDLNTNDPATPVFTATLDGYGAQVVAHYEVEASAGDTRGVLFNTSSYSAGSNDANVINHAYYAPDRMANTGSALFLDGDRAGGSGSYVDTGLIADTTALPSTTWSAWVYAEPRSGLNMPIFCADDFSRGLRFSAGRLQVGTGASWLQVGDASYGEWIHLGVAYTPSAAAVFVNGRRISFTQNVGGQASAATLLIGKDNFSFEHFHGLIDDIVITNYEVTEAEMRLQALRVPDPVAYYPVSSGLTGADVTGNHSSGDVSSFTYGTDRYSATGEAIQFTGAEDIELTDLTNSLDGNSGAVAFWFKPVTGSGVSGKTFFYSGAAGGIEIRWNNGSVDVIRGNRTETVATNLNIDHWYHVSLTWNASNLSAAFNGDVVVSNQSYSPSSSDGQTTLGSRKGSNHLNWIYLDDLIIYDRKLSNTELKTLGRSLDRGLLAYYPLNNTTDDYSKNNNPVSTDLSGSYGRNGLPLQSFSFDGNSNTVAPHQAYYDGLTGLTISAWVKFGIFGKSALSSDLQGLVTKDSDVHSEVAANNEFGLHIDPDHASGRAALEFEISDGSIFSRVTVPRVLSRITFNEYHHIAAVWDGTTQKIYFDGEEVDSTTTAITALSASGQPLSIGGIATDNRYFLGQMDDVRIYNRGLSETELAQLGPLTGREVPARFALNTSGDDNSLNGFDLSAFGATTTPVFTGGNPVGGGAVDMSIASVYRMEKPLDPLDVLFSSYPSFSITGWMRLPSVDEIGIGPGPEAIRVAVMKGADLTTGGSDYEFFVGYDPRESGEGFSFGVSDSGTESKVNIAGFEKVVSSEWFHFAAVFSSERQRIYINGGLADYAAPAVTNTFNSGQNFVLGGNNSGGNAIDGLLDEVRFYSRALTPSEIQTLYAKFDPNQLPGLMFWLRAAGGTSTTDSTTLRVIPADTQGLGSWASFAPSTGVGVAYFEPSMNSPTLDEDGASGLPIILSAPPSPMTSLSEPAPTDEFTICIVGLATGGNYYVDPAAGGAVIEFESNGGSERIAVSDGTNTLAVQEGGSSSSSPHISCAVLAEDTAGAFELELFVNGTSVGTDSGAYTSTTFDNGGLGGPTIFDNAVGGDSLTGGIAEVIVYGEPHKAGDRKRIECYLSERYGIALSYTCN